MSFFQSNNILVDIIIIMIKEIAGIPREGDQGMKNCYLMGSRSHGSLEDHLVLFFEILSFWYRLDQRVPHPYYTLYVVLFCSVSIISVSKIGSEILFLFY